MLCLCPVEPVSLRVMGCRRGHAPVRYWLPWRRAEHQNIRPAHHRSRCYGNTDGMWAYLAVRAEAGWLEMEIGIGRVWTRLGNLQCNIPELSVIYNLKCGPWIYIPYLNPLTATCGESRV